MLFRSEAPPAPGPDVTAPTPSARALRVLIVDDNRDTVESFAMLLRASGHEVRPAYDGSTAVQFALDYRPDVVLLDIGLPGLNGYEVAKRIRRLAVLKEVVLVAMTGYGQESDLKASHDAGFNHHLVKPASPSRLYEILQLVATRDSVVEPPT